MKNRINKNLYISGLLMLFLFIGGSVMLSFFDNKPIYNLIVYNYPASTEELMKEYREELKNSPGLIGGVSIGVLDQPDKRINVIGTPLYVLVKRKDQEILFITDRLNKLNQYFLEE